MSYKDNQDLRVRDGGGWGWDEHELYTVFTPLIGPLGVAVYKAMTRLVPLVVVDPYRYRVSLRQLAEWSGMSKSSVDKQLKLILKLGMVVETRYLDGREPSYKLVSLRDLAKVGEIELKRRIGVHHTDTAPFDQRSKHALERSRKSAKRREMSPSDSILPLELPRDAKTEGVHHADTLPEETMPASQEVRGVHHVDTVSTWEAKSSTSEAMSSTAYGHPLREEKKEQELNPLPPAVQGEVEPADPGDDPSDDPDQASPALPCPGVTIGDAGFEAAVPIAAQWVAARLGITKRRLQTVIEDQLRAWCRVRRGDTLEQAAMRMAQQGRLLHEHADRLRHRPWGWQRFLSEGHWTRPLPYATDAAPRADANVGMYRPAAEDASTEREREYILANADKLEDLPGMAKFAAALRTIALRCTDVASLQQVGADLDALQEEVIQAYVANLEPAARDALLRSIDEEVASVRERYGDRSPYDFERYRASLLQRRVTAQHDVPRLSLEHMPSP